MKKISKILSSILSIASLVPSGSSLAVKAGRNNNLRKNYSENRGGVKLEL